MRIRGDRECRDCGTRWSYYETGSVVCPDCGSVVSVGLDERTLHTDESPDLDLSTHRSTVAESGIEAAADDLQSTLRRYRNRRGFVAAGELLDLDGTVLAAAELERAVARFGNRRPSEQPTDEERAYVLTLLGERETELTRPPPEDVPDGMVASRGLAVAEVVRAYCRAVREWLSTADTASGTGAETSPDTDAGDGASRGRRLLGRIGERAKRIEALRGGVSATESEALVVATRRTADYLRTGDREALDAARGRLDDP